MDVEARDVRHVVPGPAPERPRVQDALSAPVSARARGGRGAAAAGGPAFAQAPPFALPGEHFAAALLFLLAGALGVVRVAPELATGAFLSPRVAAVTHLFTLGWITTSIMGALYQLLPVALGQPIRSVRAGHVAWLLYVPGLWAFVAGLLLVRTALMLGGAALFACGVLLFAGNVALTLRAARTRDVTWWALAAAIFFLLITLVLGLALAGNLRWGYMGGGRLSSIGVHLHVALAGWVLLVMIGVGNRLLPMFLLSHGASDRCARAAVALVTVGAAMLAFLHHAPPLASRWIPALLIAAGCGCFLAQARAYYATRHRPGLDPGMRIAAAALAVIGISLTLAAPVVFSVASARLTTAYVLAALLGISLFVAAHYYKIVPFLVWYHRCAPLAGRRPVPLVSDLYSSRLALRAGALLVTGALALVAAVLLGAPIAARAAALVLAAGVTVEGVQMLLLWRFRP